MLRRGVDWPGEGFEALRGELSAAEPAEGFGPWRLAPGRGGFNAAPYNEPIALAIDPASPPDASLLGSYLHGVRNHPDLHNPVTFHVEYARAGEFAVSVADVSLHGGAGLLLTLDGAEAMRKDFPNSPDAPQDKAPYLGRHAIPVPAGRHTIRVENPGADWLLVGYYEFQGLPAPPPLRLIGLRGEATALAWLWNSTAVWDREIRGTALLPLNDVEAALQGFAPGSVWRVRPFDPWTGEWGGESEAKADAAGQIALRLDSLERDWAWRLETRPY